MPLLDEIQVRVYRSHIKIPLIFFVPALTLLTVFSLVYFHLNSPHAWRAAESQLHDGLGGHFRLGHVEVSPGLTSVEISGLEVMDPQGETVAVADSLMASLDPLMLLSGRVEFERAVLEGADVSLEYDDSLNLLEALGLDDRDDSDDEESSRPPVGFSDVEIRDSNFEFDEGRFGFSIDEVVIPEGAVFVERDTQLITVDELVVPEVDFRFEHHLFEFAPEDGPWEFTARNFEIEDWRWVNEGFTVERAATEVDGIELEAGGQMAFPDRDGERQVLYDAHGSVRAAYHSNVLEYFTGGSVRFGISEADVEVVGNLDAIQGNLTDVHVPAFEANGIHLQNLRAEHIGLNNRLLETDKLTGEFYGADFEADNAFFNILDQKYGADVAFAGLNPRALMRDVTGEDQPFLAGTVEGALRMVGEIPSQARPQPMVGSPLAHDAMARFATMEVIEELTYRRDTDELFPNQRLDIEVGSRIWFDQRRIGVPNVQARSGNDRFGLADFVLEYHGLNFERLAGDGPATVTGQIAEIGPYATYYGVDGLEGPARFEMTMEGFFGSPQWWLTGSMDDPRWRVGADEVLEGESIDVELVGDRGEIGIRELVGQTEFGDFEVVGSVGWYRPPPAARWDRPWPIWEDRINQPLDLEVTVRDLEMAAVSHLIDDELKAEGSVDADLELGGSVQRTTGGFEGRMADGAVRDQPVQGARARGEFRPDGIELEEATVDLGAAGLFEGAGRYGWDGDFQFELEGESIDLAEIREFDEMPMQPGGRARFYADGSGTIDDPVFSAGGQVRDFAIDGRRFGDIALAADTVDDIVHVSGGLLPWLTATVEIPLDESAPFYARFGMEELQLMDFLPELALHPMLDDAQATGTAELYFERDFSRYQAIFNLADLQVDSRGQTINNLGNVIIGLNDGEIVTFERASFESGGQHFSVEGAVALASQLVDVRVEGDLDLALLESARAGFPELFPEFFVDAQGYANVDLNVSGTPGSFISNGVVEFGSSEWTLRFLPDPMVVDGGRMVFEGDTIRIPENAPLEGTLLGGATRVAGTIGYLEDHHHEADMRMWSHNMSWRIPELTTLAFDTNLRLQASDWTNHDTWLVSGDVDILDGVYQQEFNVVEQEIAGRVLGAFQPQTEQYEAGLLEAVPMLNDIEFDMNLRARDGVRFQTSVDRLEADMELRFDLLLQDTLANPRVTGDLDVLDGHVSFQGEAFQIRSGTISFAEDVANPYLDIEAGADVRNTCQETDFRDEVSPAMTLRSNIETGETQEYHVTLNLEGQLENMSIQMESNPYADQRDIVSMLLTGCRVDQLTASGASRPTLEVALGPLLGRLESEIADVVAVDEFTITPGVERTQVRVSDTLTRRLNWHFHLDTGFADATGGQQARLEYRLSDRWTAELSERSHDDEDDFLIDLKLNYRLPLD